jgi:hypothetical protein
MHRIVLMLPRIYAGRSRTPYDVYLWSNWQACQNKKAALRAALFDQFALRLELHRLRITAGQNWLALRDAPITAAN